MGLSPPPRDILSPLQRQRREEKSPSHFLFSAAVGEGAEEGNYTRKGRIIDSAACLPSFFLRPPSYTDFPLIQERDVYGKPAALQYTKLIPSDVTEGEPKNPVIYTGFYRSFSGEVAYSERITNKYQETKC
jgi:hypothetical protein